MSAWAFGSGPDLTVGLEEELMLVDPDTRALQPAARGVLARMESDPALAGHEAYAAQIELRSPPRACAADAAADLAQLRSAVQAAGGTPMAAGLHPGAAFGDAELVDEPRYEHVAETMRGLIRRTPEAALHVHVGMPSPSDAVGAFNALRRQLPLIVALSASSPWWFGRDSGLASARWAAVRAYPRRGIPAAIGSFDEYLALVDATLRAGALPDATLIWWDVRLHPSHGTVEVREADVQARLEDAAAIAALIRAVAAEGAADPRQRREPPSEALAEACFVAARDGISARVLCADGELRPAPEAVAEAAAALGPAAESLGDADALAGLARLCSDHGAERRRRAGGEGGAGAIVDQAVAETAQAAASQPKNVRASSR